MMAYISIHLRFFPLDSASGAQIKNCPMKERESEPVHAKEDLLAFCFWIVTQQMLGWRAAQSPKACEIE